MLFFNRLFLSVSMHSSPLIHLCYVAINLHDFRSIFIQIYLEVNHHGQVIRKNDHGKDKIPTFNTKF